MSYTKLQRAAFGLGVLLTLATTGGCKGNEEGAAREGVFGAGDAPGLAKADGAAAAAADPATIPHEGGPRMGAVEYTATIYTDPDPRSAKAGYLRAGGTVVRGEKPVKTDDCPGGWYRVLPFGHMCATKEATTDLGHPIIKALTLRPDVSKPMPYPYAFVRAVAPNYYRVPTKAEQFQYEMALDKHLRSYKRLHLKWDALSVGANDIELDFEGNAVGVMPDDPPPLDYNAIYGGNGSDEIPWFFADGRKLPNIASFKVPDYAIITNRVKRKAMIAILGTFVGPNDRRFAITTDARLVPTSKLKPDRGSTFHGVNLKGDWNLPLGFVKVPVADAFDLSRAALDKKDRTKKHEPVQLTGRSRSLGGNRMLEAKDGSWYKEHDLAIAAKPGKLPSFAKAGKRWIDISIQTQTLVLYEGNKAIYATAISTGRDGLGDPKKTLSTPTGIFAIREKHITTTMDANEVDNQFELRDVPWVQYFKGGYAMHAAPWHEDYGRPRSHGCINLSPIDARRIFMFTSPMLPVEWHGVETTPVTGEGTTVFIHP